MPQSTAKFVELKPNRSLLDPSFDGYKLYLQSLPVYSLSLENEVAVTDTLTLTTVPRDPSYLDRVKLSIRKWNFAWNLFRNELGVDQPTLPDDQYSYQHVKAFGAHNCLILDPWNDDFCYFVDDQWRVLQVRASLEYPLKKPVCVFTVPNKDNQRLVPGRRHASLVFPSPEVAVLSDGAVVVYLLDTMNRDESKAWQLRYSTEPLKTEESVVCPFVILDSAIYRHSENERECTRCDYILLNVVDNPDETKARKSPFITNLTWITLMSEDHSQWTECRRRVLCASTVPDLTTLQSGGEGVFIAAQREFRLVRDSDRPEEEVMEQETENEASQHEYLFNWSQTDDDVTAVFVLPEMTSSSDVTYRLSTSSIELGIQDQGVLLKGSLYGAVKPDESTWTICDGRLELALTKQHSSLWPELIPGNRDGRLVLDGDQLAKLDDITSSLRVDPSIDGAPYNAQELEDVDAFPDDTSLLVLFDGNSNSVSHKSYLSSHQWLFNVRAHADQPLALCLRHDVDGLLWQLTNDEHKPWKHVATFNALGYVQASKRERKFSSCAPDFSYSIVCDAVRHVYIYRQNSPTATPLRNRKTGENVKAIGKQQVVSLDSTDTIVGMQCTNEKVYLLTERQMYIVRINVKEVV